MAFVGDLTEGTHDVGLGRKVHGEIRIFPVAEHTEADEIALLQLHLFARILAAGRAEFGMGDLYPRLAFFLLYVVLDRQAVTVPAGNVGRIETAHRLSLNDKVFQRFINRVAKVQLAVRIGRTVVQDEFGFADVFVGNALIDIQLLPAREHFGLALGKAGLHRKFRKRQIECLFEINCFARVFVRHDLGFFTVPRERRGLKT